MAQYAINPYHWPGWMLTTSTACVGILTFLFFVETRSLAQVKTKCSHVNSLKLSVVLSNKWKNHAIVS